MNLAEALVLTIVFLLASNIIKREKLVTVNTIINTELDAKFLMNGDRFRLKKMDCGTDLSDLFILSASKKILSNSLISHNL